MYLCVSVRVHAHTYVCAFMYPLACVCTLYYTCNIIMNFTEVLQEFYQCKCMTCLATLKAKGSQSVSRILHRQGHVSLSILMAIHSHQSAPFTISMVGLSCTTFIYITYAVTMFHRSPPLSQVLHLEPCTACGPHLLCMVRFFCRPLHGVVLEDFRPLYRHIVCTHIRKYIHTYTSTNTCACARTHTCTHTHTHTRTHTHTHTSCLVVNTWLDIVSFDRLHGTAIPASTRHVPPSIPSAQRHVHGRAAYSRLPRPTEPKQHRTSS